jgi:hypothetical protein
MVTAVSAAMMAIVSLLFRGGPPAIVRGIRSIIVNSIKRKPRRAATHIGEEVLIRVPTLTDCNSSAAVSIICGIFKVKAALAHALPSSIFPAFFSCFPLPTFAVPIVGSCRLVSVPTAARQSVPFAQIKIENRKRTSAITLTDKFSSWMWVKVVSFQNRKAAKTLAGKYPVWSGHRSLSSGSMSSGGRALARSTAAQS